MVQLNIMRYLIIDKRQRIDIGKDIPTGSARLLEELEKKDIAYDFVYNDQLEFIFQDGNFVIMANGKDILSYSHIVFRGHSLENEKEYHFKRYIIDHIDNHNLKNPDRKILVQNSEAIKRLPYYNKIAFAQLCAINNIPYFNTYYRTDGEYLSNREYLKKYPLIIKEYSGANRLQLIDGKEKIKKNVFKLNNNEDYTQTDLVTQELTNFFIQEFSDSQEDYRFFIKLGKLIGGWKRRASSGFMTVNKGIYEMYNNPESEIREIAKKMADVLKADFMAVDIMHINGKPHIQEISLHPGYKAYETKIDGEPINVAEAIITAFRD